MQVTLALAAMTGVTGYVVNPEAFHRAVEAQVIEQHEDDPTYKFAFVGYGDTCKLETWNYPARYEGIQDWKDKDPEKAKPLYIEARPNDEGCKRNFNPKNPADALPSMDYGNNYGNRFKDIYSPRPA
jgi:hypothetical protein